MSEVQPCERELHISQSDDDHSVFHVFTDSPYWIRRLDRIAPGKPVANGEGKQYVLRAEQVLIRAKKREVSEKSRLLAAERMRTLNRRVAAENLVSDMELTRIVGND